MTLAGKVAIITGGGSGIGRASAIKLAQQSVKVSVSDVNVDGGETTIKMVQEAGGDGIFIYCNVAKSDEVEAMVDKTVDIFGGLDIAMNNAGVGGALVPTHDIDESTWDQVMNINLKGVWLCMKYEIPHMLENGGSIINVSSLAGLVGFRSNAVYSASKHGIIGLTKSAALEYAKTGIRVNAICPGFTETPMVTDMIDSEIPWVSESTRRISPMRRLGLVDEVADAVVYLADDTSSFVNGVALPIDGGTAAQ